MKSMADKRRYRFTKKEQSKDGIFSFRMAILSFLLLVVDVIFSFARGGKAGYLAGVIALVAFLFAVYGFYIGMKSFSDNKKASPLFPVIGSISSGVLVVIWMTLFLSGIR